MGEGAGWESDELPDEVDVVVIGAGIGGLSCAALLARYGLSVAVVEAHYVAGGAAHGFVRDDFHFDAGPSYFLGLSSPPGESINGVRQVLDAVGGADAFARAIDASIGELGEIIADPAALARLLKGAEASVPRVAAPSGVPIDGNEETRVSAANEPPPPGTRRMTRD